MRTTFKQFLSEDGAVAGVVEVAKTDVDKAYEYASKVFKSKGRDIDEEIPNFKENYAKARAKAIKGHTVRKDMPVIEDKDVKKFQERLRKGNIDVANPYGDVTDRKKKFPQHTKGKDQKNFLKGGKEKHDGSVPDDKVKVEKGKEVVGQLNPIQKQIYLDKSIPAIAENGAKASIAFFKKTNFIASKDMRIIDGHHRFLSSVLLDPKMKVNVVKIDLPITELLALSLAYGDAIGNKRNA